MIDVSPTNKVNTHHISLEDPATGTKYGLILTPDGNAINRRPRQSSNFVPFTQNDWSGGRGLKLATDDRSRFADSKRLNTRRPGQVTLGGLETYTSGHRQVEQFMPSDANGLTWQALTGDHRFIAYKLTASANGNRARVYFWVRRRGDPGTLETRMRNDAAGNPGGGLKLVQVTTAEIDDTISMLYEFTFESVQAVVTPTLYWVEISGDAGDDASNHWEVGTDPERTNALTKSSADGAVWNDATYDLYFRLVDDTDIAGVIFFEYKSQLYMLTRPTASAAPKLYMNGYRGVATGIGQSRTVLQDTTLNAPTNSLVGALLYILEGPNSEWQQPYRTILANDNVAKTITTDEFGKAHVAGETVYVILGADVWTEIGGHGLTVLPTSVAATEDICYFAQGDKTKLQRMREFLNTSVWSRGFASEDNYAKLLKVQPHTTKGTTICKVNDADNSGRPSFAQASAEPWGTRLKFPYLINDCEATAGWVAGAGAALAVDSTDFMSGTKSLAVTVNAGPASPTFYLALGSEMSVFARANKLLNLAGQRALRFWFKSSVNVLAGQIKIFLSAAANASTSALNVDLPFLVAGEWQHLTLPYTDMIAGIGGIQSVGFYTTHPAAVYHIDGLEIVPAGAEVPLGKEGGKITGLELYGDPEVPWVLREGDIGSIENGVYNPIPIREYKAIQNIHNGMGHLVHDVYLYVSFLQGLEEYYRSNLDDVGPNKEEGLPENRQGYITSMQGYPDRFLYNIDAGTAGYSSIMSRKGGGHHEDFRSDAPGRRIRAIHHQVIPGDMADRLWFSEGEDIGYLPMPGNTVNELTDPTYRFTQEGVLELAWIGDDQQRIFSSVKLGLENVSAARCIEWDYKLDEAASWTPMATPFTTGPVQRLDLNQTGKRLKLRFRAQTNDNYETPRITSINVSTTERPETHFSYSMTFVYSDNGRDLLNQAENYTRSETLLAQLDAWMLNQTLLLMHHQSEQYDSKTIYLEPVQDSPVANETAEQQDKHSGTLIAVEPQ